MRFRTILLFCSLVSSLSLVAQTDANKGQISGTVYDAAQAVIPGARVVVQRAETGFRREVLTNSVGQYRVVLLDPGTYTVSAEKTGFAPKTAEGIRVTVGASVGVDFVLEVEATAQTVEVTTSAVNITLPAPAATLGLQAITNLPINGRRFQDFAVLTPTVQVDPQRGQLSFVGQRGINSNVMLDGADYNQPFFGGIRGGERSNFIFTVPQSAIQEFQVVTSGYSAEYGRSTGGVLNAITRSGTNDWRGEAFYQLRHKEMGLKDPIQRIASLETQHQGGASLGGPIRRDRLFVFGALERQDAATPRRVFFAQLQGRTPNENTREAFEFFRSEEKPFIQTNDAWAYTVRGDYQTEAGHRLTLRYNGSSNVAENAVSVGGALSPFTNRTISNDGTEKDRTHTGTAQYTHLFSPTVLNDLRFSGTYEQRPRLSNSSLPQVSTVIGIFGARNFLPTTQDDRRLQIADALSITRGRHTVKVGLDYNHVTTAQVFGFNQFGSFSLSGSNVDQHLEILSVGGAIPNRFDDRSVTYSRQLGNLLAAFDMHQLALYAQDSWQIRGRLTLELGLRWEGQFNPRPEANNDELVRLVRGFRFPNGLTLDPTLIPDSKDQWMPRLGFAWRPFGGLRTVVRGYTGFFYASTPMLVMAGPTNNFRLPPADVSISLTATATQTVYQQLLAVGVDLNRSPLSNLPVIPVETVQRAASLALGGQTRSPFAGANLIAMAPDFRNPRALQAGIGFETEFARNFTGGVQFHYVNSVNLLRNHDYNLPAPIIRPPDATRRPFYGLRSGNTRPIPTLGSLWVRASSARSMFRGVSFNTQYRRSTFQFGASYTLSETFSDDDSERDATGVNAADLFNLRLDYGYSRLDVRHRFTGYFLYDLPLGLQASGTLTARSGLPVNALTGTDTNEDLASNDRPFTAPGVVMPRNSFRNRGVVTNDFRILKNFGLGEQRRLQFSVEFFNLLNLDNVVYSGVNGGIFGGIYGPGLNPDGTPAPVDPRFRRLKLADGTYDRNNMQVGTPLQVQFGLRFFF